ncbi:hypothetical protein C7H19_12705 [Aphanothece hegewaldii CCALA 016]|uniref:Uncharacterized protein n=1 Tax=Aphanothece hegewaldii CCALA 016 TaxID=2107694 RepID=A0A2T1LXA9_9CHRO|nr:DUF6391 domain-containing protein [Aphanothece hegewaldii]PSF36820.1 hypothetical protein C7H19_12705 [Aphanothece hegewaldii CCALA 016]
MNNTTSATGWESDWIKPNCDQDSTLVKQFGFLPGLKEILMLRQVHALEHSTVWVLSEMQSQRNRSDWDNEEKADNENLGGLSTDQGFYLYGQVNPLELQRAVRQALYRIKTGEWNLAVHPRCGTNLSVAMFVTGGLAFGIHLLLPKGPIEQLIGLGVATAYAFQVSPDLGQSAQKYLTTSIPFNLEMVDVTQTKDFWGRSAYFVRVQWQESQ